MPSPSPLYNNVGYIYYLLAQFHEALEYLHKSIENKSTIDPPNYSNLIMTHSNSRSVYQSLGESAKMIEVTEKIIELQQLALPASHADLVESYLFVANAYTDSKEYSKEMKLKQKVKDIWSKQSVWKNNHQLAQNCYDLAFLYQHMTDYDQALIFYQKAIEIQRTILN